MIYKKLLILKNKKLSRTELQLQIEYDNIAKIYEKCLEKQKHSKKSKETL